MVFKDLGKSLACKNDAVSQILMALFCLKRLHLLLSGLMVSAIESDLIDLFFYFIICSLISRHPIYDLLKHGNTFLHILDDILLQAYLIFDFVLFLNPCFILHLHFLHPPYDGP